MDAMDINIRRQVLQSGMKMGGFVSYSDHTDVDLIFGVQISDLIEEGLLEFRWMTGGVINNKFQMITTKKGEEFCRALQHLNKL